jgi:guanosine-3',5'-bis(diphosphate) 3'-pyrophosphohydrolase
MSKGQMLSNMLILAVNGHAGQFDKAGMPYILHTLKVMHYLRSEDEELQCGAVGHDLFEDTTVTAADMRAQGISERVINMIYGVTKMPGESFEEYKAKVMANADSIKIKKADLRHNSDIRRMKGVTEKDIKRTIKYMNFYDELVAAEQA